MKYIINTKGDVIFRAENAGWFEKGQGLCPVQVNGKWGYINTTGNVVIPCVYEDAYNFKNEGVTVVKQKGKYGLINKRGEILVPCVKSDYDYVPLPHDGVICIYIENLEETKCIDVSGNHLFTISGRVGDFSEGVATITSYKEEGKYSIGVINKSGEYIIPEGIYSHISAFHYGVAEVSSETTGKRGFINRQGEVVVPLKYDSFYASYPSPVLCAIIGDKYGYVDIRNGKELYPITLDKKSIDTHYLDKYTDNMFIFSIGEDIYIYNLDNCKLFKSSKYKEIYCYCDGLCCVSDKNSGKIGFIDKEGKLAIPCVFDEPFYVYEFHGNICAMSNHIIDKYGKVIRKIPHGHQICYCGRHDQRRDYYIESYATGTQTDIIDVKGKTIFSGFYVDDLSEFPIPVQDSVTRKWGYVDRNGKLVIPYQFNESYLFHDGFAILDEPITKKTSQSTSSSKTQTTYHTSTKPSSSNSNNSNQGCYIATAVYGSYDCPEVWTLRRYRDNVLDRTWYGKLFIRIYYSISPTLVRWFGTTHWFRELFYKPLNNWVARLNKQGFKNTPYRDKY